MQNGIPSQPLLEPFTQTRHHCPGITSATILCPSRSETSLHKEGTFLKRKKTLLRRAETIWDNRHYTVYQEGNSHSLNSVWFWVVMIVFLSWKTGAGHSLGHLPLAWLSLSAKALSVSHSFSSLIQMLTYLTGTSMN